MRLVFSVGFLLAFLATTGCLQAPRYSGPVIDIHTHLDPEGEIIPPRVADEVTLLAELRRLPEARAGVVTIAPKGDLPATRALNDRLLALVRAHPEELFALASVHPDDGPLALDEVDRVAAAGAAGLKLHPNTQHFEVDSPAVAAVLDRAAERGLPVLFDGYSPFDADETGKFLMLAVTHPKAKLVLAHMSGPRFQDMMVFAIARQFAWYPRNVWVDLSAVSHFFAASPYSEQLRFVCRSIGIDRVMFGSDYPVVTPAQALTDVRALGFTSVEEQQVLHDTAAALFAPRQPGGPHAGR